MGVAADAGKIAFKEVVDGACRKLETKGKMRSDLSADEKQTVEDMLCDSLVSVAEIAVDKDLKLADAVTYFGKTAANAGQLSNSQQLYCRALAVEIAINSGDLAFTAYATYTGTLAGVKVGAITGMIVAGSMTAGGAAVPGAIGGGVLGGLGPFAIGSYQMFKTVNELVPDLIKYNSQCGALSMPHSAPPSVSAFRPPAGSPGRMY